MSGPLSHFKVLYFTTLFPGPFATLYLADLGADVLQIVSPSRVDFADIEPPFFPGTNVSAMAAFLRRNKRSIAPIKFSKTKPSYRWAGSGPGVHTAEVLRSLGYTDNEITEFEKTGLFK